MRLFTSLLKSPDCSSSRSFLLSLINNSLLSHSPENKRVSTTPVLARSCTPADANSRAEDVAKMVGISSTISAPHNRAALARGYLSKQAISPLWVKEPDMATIIWSAFKTYLAYSIWSLWPLWNGLYSATIPTTIFVPPKILFIGELYYKILLLCIFLVL